MVEVEVRNSPIEGLGVFAVSPIREGELIREYNLVREVTSETPIDRSRGEKVEHCTYPGDRVFLVGFPDRHFNHSCDPNAFKRFNANSIQLISLRAITQIDG
jgi:SET domain-containing protein